MPTNRYTPVRGFPPGRSNLSEHRPEPVFPDGEIWKLSVLLNRPVDDLKPVLQAVEESVRLIDDTEGAPRSSQWAALDEIFRAAERLQMQLAEIDPSSRGRVLDEYASEYARQYDVSPSSPAARYDARDQYKADLAALARLSANITLAGRSRRGAPPKFRERHAALRLIEAYETITGAEFVNSTRQGRDLPRRFILAALSRFNVSQKTSNEAIKAVMRRRANEET